MPDLFIPKKTDNQISPHSHPFASFCSHPNVSFRNQEPDEKILLLLRAHFITNILWIITALILAFIPIGIGVLGIDIRSFLSFFPERYFLVLTIFYYLLILTYALVNFITWYYNVFLVTQRRIVDIDFSDIVYHNVALTKLSLVEDVHYTQIGFIASLFNFGDLFVQTAGELKNFEALKVPRPNDAVNIIENLIGVKPYGK